MPNDDQDYKEYQEYLQYLESQGPDAAAAKTGAQFGTNLAEFLQGPKAYMDKRVAQEKPPVKGEYVGGTPPMVMPAGAVPKGLMKAAELINRTLPGRVAASGVQGAVEGAIANPNDRMAGAAQGGVAGLGLGAAGEAAGKVAGLVGDTAMQAAVGRKKYTPGVGTELADEGIIGTRGMMRNQVKKGLENRGSQLEELAKKASESGLKGDVGIQALEMGDKAMKAIGGGSNIPIAKADLPKSQAIEEFTQELATRAPETPSQMLARRRAAGSRAYRGKEDPLQSLIGQMSKEEQAMYSQKLKELVPEIAPVDAKYAALKRAQAGLDAEASIPKSLMGVASLGANTIPGGAASLSALGQIATKGGQAASSPLTRQTLLEALLSNNKTDK